LAVNKKTAQNLDVWRFDVRKLSELEVRKHNGLYRFAALRNLNNSENLKGAWEKIKENIETSAKESLGLHEFNQHKSWFDEECLRPLDQRKRVKMQWLQDPNQSNIDHVDNVRHTASSYFRNKKM
jgi:hypothetical protein